jgi:very-short-patch-repair endonuclease
MNIPDFEELDSPKKKGTLYIKKHYPEFHQYILDTYPHINKFNAGIYLYYHHMNHPVCPVCGGYVPFLDETRGFQRCCSSKCANSDPEFRKRVTETCLRKYGTKTPTENPEIKKKAIDAYIANNGGMGNASRSVAAKQKSTMVERYGAEHALQCEQFVDKSKTTQIARYGGVGAAAEKIKSNIEKTNLERYGCRSSFGSKEVRAKTIKTNLERYGCKVASQNPEIAAKVSSTKIQAHVQSEPDLLDITVEDGVSIYTMSCPHAHCTKCKDKTYVTPAYVLYDRRKNRNELCTKLMPVQRGRNQNTSCELFIKDILNNCGILVPEKHEDHAILNRRGIDFYLPSHNLAIECNGVYWHSTHKKSDSKYHYKKFADCAAQGIRLLTIWQDWIFHKPDIVESIIKTALGCVKHITAGSYAVENIDSDKATEFLNVNCIYGSANSSTYYGLYEEVAMGNNKRLTLVAVASFIKHRGVWEMTRYCTRLNCIVDEGFETILHRFIKDYEPDVIRTFSPNDICSGEMYADTGFEKVRENQVYWYVDRTYNRFHRSVFTKESVSKRGWLLDNKSLSQIMYDHGYYKIYDSGQTKWVLQIKREDR